MALILEDEDFHDMNFLLENHSWDPSNSSANWRESKENTNSKNQKNEKDEALMNKNAIRDPSNVAASGEGKGEKSRESDEHEMHIWTERERRKRMKNMFSSLHAMLPHLPSKVDKSTVVDEAVSYIKNLQETVEKLEKQKQERVQYSTAFGYKSSSSTFVTAQGFSSNNNFSNAMMGASSNALPVSFDKTWTSSNMVLSVCGDEAQFCVCAAHKPGLMSSIAFVLEKYEIELVSANISCIGNGNAIMIQVHGKRASHQFLNANSVEEIYRQAAGEIMLWIA
ncbi:unnamed protein product [Sphenostylis stenocarpa]|uniref:BHLH domain-containing protein n=1 Tax=Sphenostylis stenocarpa TaxID=92480 RepID=A0AA86S2G0_9FABA|nr:unnamed protein product [Sphenostylis stenocarpa]